MYNPPSYKDLDEQARNKLQDGYSLLMLFEPPSYQSLLKKITGLHSKYVHGVEGKSYIFFKYPTNEVYLKDIGYVSHLAVQFEAESAIAVSRDNEFHNILMGVLLDYLLSIEDFYVKSSPTNSAFYNCLMDALNIGKPEANLLDRFTIVTCLQCYHNYLNAQEPKPTEVIKRIDERIQRAKHGESYDRVMKPDSNYQILASDMQHIESLKQLAEALVATNKVITDNLPVFYTALQSVIDEKESVTADDFEDIYSRMRASEFMIKVIQSLVGAAIRSVKPGEKFHLTRQNVEKFKREYISSGLDLKSQYILLGGYLLKLKPEIGSVDFKRHLLLSLNHHGENTLNPNDTDDRDTQQFAIKALKDYVELSGVDKQVFGAWGGYQSLKREVISRHIESVDKALPEVAPEEGLGEPWQKLALI